MHQFVHMFFARLSSMYVCRECSMEWSSRLKHWNPSSLQSSPLGRRSGKRAIALGSMTAKFDASSLAGGGYQFKD